MFPKSAREKVISSITKGNTLKTACRAARLNYVLLSEYQTTINPIMDDPAFHPDDYSDQENEVIAFFQDVRSAQAAYEEKAVTHINEAQVKDWKAAQFMLQQRNPEDWAPPQKPTRGQLADLEAQPSPAAGILGNSNVDLRRLNSQELQLLEDLITKASTPAPAELEAAQEVVPANRRLPDDAHPDSKTFPVK
jgi:hypothetical protein